MLTLLFFSCKKEEATPPCKRSTIDVLTGYSWQATEGNVGTVSEVFYADDKGKLVSDGKDKITDVKVNSQGYITESTSVDAENKVTVQKFMLMDCN